MAQNEMRAEPALPERVRSMEGLGTFRNGENNVDKQKIEQGIAAYRREQRVLLRLLRKRGTFTEQEFDGWFRGGEWRRPLKFGPPLTGDTFILGMGQNGANKWAVMLELLQMMMAIDLFDANTIDGSVVYSQGPNV